MELVNPESPETKEMASWEMFHSKWTIGAQPGRPYRYQEFPMMVYKAQRVPPGLPQAGKIATGLAEPENFGFRDQDEWNRAIQAAYNFSRSCQRTVENEVELSRAMEEGYRKTQTEAVDHAESREAKVAETTHLRQVGERGMSEKAKAEAAKFDAENFMHQPEVPEKPRQKRKYTRKAVAQPSE